MTNSIIHSKRPETAKELYPYQTESIEKILSVVYSEDDKSNLLFQLPTGGGKTIIFSEVIRRFIKKTSKRVLILTHRIELLKQTASVLEDVGVHSKIITSEVKEIENETDYFCFLAMVETLHNRLEDDSSFIPDIELVIVDEAHYNSFRKLFRHFKNAVIIGVTATPLSSNLNLPLRDNYKKLIVGDSISSLISKGYLSDASTFTYDVNLRSLKIGVDGDYTVNSLEKLYGDYEMQDKLLEAYLEKSKGKKTLIFNSGIATSRAVKVLFENAGLEIKHLDSTNNKKERHETLKWFKEKPDAILTSVGILTTGFDEPSVETIILNRATRSLTLYHQMIGRGSRRTPNKSQFNIIDLGDNARRLGLWQEYIDWMEIFINPNKYLEYLSLREEEIDKGLIYSLPENIKKKFPASNNFDFDIEELYNERIMKGLSTIEVIDMSIDNHFDRIVENANNLFDGIDLMHVLEDEIAYRLRIYTNCMSKTTRNYYNWLLENYIIKLKKKLRNTLPISEAS